ncbi:MAG: membrane protein insertase YidC [Flavobacteriales bacterium]|nr:membrane protein insertase YidC [Flavobacteriales bacterium]|tara:strand:- start:16738 stop:18477 length:1740 start_codon:yes stop_codon:yes gene_type:complete
MEQKTFDSNFLIGILLIFGILLWFNTTQIPVEEYNEKSQVEKNDVNNYNNQIQSESIEPNFIDEIKKDEPKDFELEFYELSNELLTVIVSNQGGSIHEVILNDYYTYDSLDLKLVSDLDFNFSFYLKKQKINSKELRFINVLQEENKISLEYQDQDFNELLFTYELLPNSYQVKFYVSTREVSSYIEPDKLIWAQKINQFEKNIDNERNTTTINYSYNNKSSKQLPLMKDSDKLIEAPIWIAHKQQFFSTVISSDNTFQSANINSVQPENDQYVKYLKSEFLIEYDSNDNNYVFDLFFIPNKYSLLSSFNKGFESLVPLGWGIFGWVNKYLVIPMFNFLENFGLNYGVIILLIALVIKLILFLPTKSSYLSMAKMRVLKPEIDAINEKIEDPMKRQQAHMNLYRKTGVNPLGGCLPMLLQLPILIALFRFFPASIELRQQPFLWADDLSSYDSILDLGFSIPLYGDHISLFALLMTLATALQMVYSNQMSSSSAQMPQMKYVMYTMPVIFLFVMNNYSSALSYYYFLANIITFAQQAWIRKNIDDKKLYAMLQANKSKPVKKSKFQQRLEELSRQNQKK